MGFASGIKEGEGFALRRAAGVNPDVLVQPKQAVAHRSPGRQFQLVLKVPFLAKKSGFKGEKGSE